MNLSSLFQKPTQSAYFTANTTGQVITSSPAIVYGVYVHALDSSNGASITITSGSNVVSKVYSSAGGGGNLWSSYGVANGIDCDSGITVDVSFSNTGGNAFAGFHYILK